MACVANNNNGVSHLSEDTDSDCEFIMHKQREVIDLVSDSESEEEEEGWLLLLFSFLASFC